MAVADGEGAVHLVEHLDEAVDEDRASWSPLPDLVPLLAWRQSRPPHLLVWADRGGADLHAAGWGVPPIDAELGDDDPESKFRGGGWSHHRFQHRAEDDWIQTAQEVADALAWTARQIDARLVVLGGDIRACQLIQERLPGAVAELVRQIDQGRAEDGSEAARDHEVRRLLATTAAEATVAVLEAAEEELGQHDRGVQGPDATVDALNRAAVDLLLVSDAGGDERSAWVGPAPVPVGLGDTPATALDQPIRAPLTAALVRAALATGAGIRVVPHHGPLDGGIGALLRWGAPPDPSPT